jgi:hypothetical protein
MDFEDEMWMELAEDCSIRGLDLIGSVDRSLAKQQYGSQGHRL